MLMAFRIAEHEDVLLPRDGEPGWLHPLPHHAAPGDDPGRGLHPPPCPCPCDRYQGPGRYSPLTGPEYYFGFRWEIERSMRDARQVIREVEEPSQGSSGDVWPWRGTGLRMRRW